MGSFWGLSSTGKNAKAQQGNIAAWQQGQSQDWANKAADRWSRAAEGQDWATSYWNNRAENPTLTTKDAKATGQDIINVDDPIARMWSRNANTRSAWEATVPKAAQVGDTLAANTTTKTERLGDYGTGQQFVIDAGADTMGGTVRNASGQVGQNLNTTYGQAGTGMADAYGRLIGDVNTNRDKMLTATDAAFAGMDKNVADYAKSVETLKPGGEFAAAQMGRSFAPAFASAQGRLRRGGVDPNGVQASAIMAGLGGQQAVAMDDQMAQGNARYVDAQGNLVGMKNNLAGGKLNTTIGLNADALNASTGLGATLANSTRDMTLAKGAEERDQIRSDAASLNAIEQQKQQQTLGLNSDTFGAGQGLLDEQSQNALKTRDMAMADFNTAAGLNQNDNQLELTDLGLRKDQYGLGANQILQNQQIQDQAAGQLTGIAQSNFGNAQGANSAAGGYAQQAANLWNQIYGQEAANAGWGTKMLGGLGTAGLNALTGGAAGSVGGLGGLSKLWGGGNGNQNQAAMQWLMANGGQLAGW